MNHARQSLRPRGDEPGVCSRRAGARSPAARVRNRPDPVRAALAPGHRSRPASSLVRPRPVSPREPREPPLATPSARSNGSLGFSSTPIQATDGCFGKRVGGSETGFEVDEGREARKGSATGRPLGQICGAGRHRPDPVRLPKGKQRSPVGKLGERTSPPARRRALPRSSSHHAARPPAWAAAARQPGRGEITASASNGLCVITTSGRKRLISDATTRASPACEITSRKPCRLPRINLKRGSETSIAPLRPMTRNSSSFPTAFHFRANPGDSGRSYRAPPTNNARGRGAALRGRTGEATEAILVRPTFMRIP